MNVAEMMELALANHGLSAPVGVPEGTPGAVQVVALCRHKVDGGVAHGGQTYWIPRERAEAAAKRDIVHVMDSARLDWWGARGRVLSPWVDDPEIVFARAPSAGSLRIAQGCGYDPGSAAYRFHSALNQSTKHASAFTRFEDTNPHCGLRQFDGLRDAAVVRESLLTADVLHCHMNYLIAANASSRLMQAGDVRSARPVQWRDGQWIVRHYHGSRPNGGTNLEHAVDERVRRAAEVTGGGLLRVGARLTICAEPGAEDLQWLPIAVPVGRYQRLRAEAGYRPRTVEQYARSAYDGNRPFLIAHSPTKRSYKGTDKFVRAIGHLQAKGLDVEALMIEGKSHGEALRLKATADACFDSFWLGIQGSGLEAGAMGLPCIAGDADVAELYKRHLGAVPYTFAGDQQGLERVIERMVVDAAFYQSEAERVSRYVLTVHDYPAVGARYESMLAQALGRPDIVTAAEPTKAARTPKRGKVAA